MLCTSWGGRISKLAQICSPPEQLRLEYMNMRTVSYRIAWYHLMYEFRVKKILEKRVKIAKQLGTMPFSQINKT